MKYLNNLNNHSLYEAYKVGNKFKMTNGKDVVSLCKQHMQIHYDIYVPHYHFLDILYANINGDKKVDSNILDPSEGYIPIAICVADTDFFAEGELARWVSLKYMDYNNPETGSLTNISMVLGQNNVDLNINDITQSYKDSNRQGIYTADWNTINGTKMPSMLDENNNFNLTELGDINMYAITDIDGKNKTNIWLTAVTEQLTWQTDSTIINNSDAGYSPAACCCARYHTLGTNPGDWYLMASGELSIIATRKNTINSKISLIYSKYPTDVFENIASTIYKTSTEYSSGHGYIANIFGGMLTNDNKYKSGAVLGMMQY